MSVGLSLEVVGRRNLDGESIKVSDGRHVHNKTCELV